MLFVKLIRNDIFMFLPCLIVCVDFEIIYLICLHPIRINYCCMCIILFNEDNNYYCNIEKIVTCLFPFDLGWFLSITLCHSCYFYSCMFIYILFCKYRSRR